MQLPSPSWPPPPCPHGSVWADCARCRPRLDSLGWALLGDPTAVAAGLGCGGFQEQLLAWAGGAPPKDAAAAAFRGHAAACATCRVDLLAAQAALAALDPGLPLPADAPSLPEADLSFLRAGPGSGPEQEPGLRATLVPPDPAHHRRAWGWAAAGLLLLLLVLSRTAGLWGEWDSAVFGPGAESDVRVPQVSEGLTTPAGAPRGGISLPTTAGRLSGKATADHRSSKATVAPTRPTPRATPALSGLLARPPQPTPPATQALPPTAVALDPAPEPDESEPDEAPSVAASPISSPWPQQAVALCALQGFGPDAGLFNPACGPYRDAAAFDLFRIHVAIGGRWRFDTCENSGGLDTVLALYPAGGFDPAEPCRNLLAAADDGCGAQAALTVELPPGDYLLLLSEQSGDLSAPYRLGVSAPVGQDVCPRVVPTPEPSAAASATIGAPTPTALPATPAGSTPTAVLVTPAAPTSTAGVEAPGLR